MKKAKELRSGNVLNYKNGIYTVLKAEHYNPSEKACVMRCKLQNIMTGNVVNDTILASDTVDDLRLDERNMQYLYKSGDMYVLMDNETYEQTELTEELFGEQIIFLAENMNVKVKFYEERPVIVELPDHIVAEIEYTENVDPGNTTGNVVKDAKLTNGYELKVPQFCKIGDKIKVDTSTGNYVSRA